MDTHDASSAGANLSFFRLRNPFVQILLTSACLFCNPGLYLAVTLLGAGGGRPSSLDMANISNGALYGVFTFSAIFAPVALNHLGPRITMMFAVTGYPIYIGALWYCKCSLAFPRFSRSREPNKASSRLLWSSLVPCPGRCISWPDSRLSLDYSCIHVHRLPRRERSWLMESHTVELECFRCFSRCMCCSG